MLNILHDIKKPSQKISFGMGCFWANDALFGATSGVFRSRVGYSGGTTLNPTYKHIGDHTEVTEIDYDPMAINFEKLLKLFWENHEYGYTTSIKRQYTSLILYYSEEQKQMAEISLRQKADKSKTEIVTEILPIDVFYPAEDYHQKYRLQQHPLIYEALELNSHLLQTSYAAARINGYLAGVGTRKNFERDITELGLSETLIDYVRKEWTRNEGSYLYC